MPKAAIFDMDGTLLDSVDLHALAWQEALLKFGHDVSFDQVRGQIGKGGDKLIPVFLTADEQDHGKELEEWRGKHFMSEYLPLVRPFAAVPELLRRARDAGLQVAIASWAKKDELKKYLGIAHITDLVDLTMSSDDAEESKPAPDIFEVVLRKLQIEGPTPWRSVTRPTTPKQRGRRRSRPSACFAAASRRPRCDKPDASRYMPARLRCSPGSRNFCSRGRLRLMARQWSVGDGTRWREN